MISIPIQQKTLNNHNFMMPAHGPQTICKHLAISMSAGLGTTGGPGEVHKLRYPKKGHMGFQASGAGLTLTLNDYPPFLKVSHHSQIIAPTGIFGGNRLRPTTNY